MSDIHQKCLEVFPGWLATLGEDSLVLLGLLEQVGLSEDGRTAIIGGLNYAFTSLDLVPDVVADVGYLDDAFVLRVVASTVLQGSSDLPDSIEQPLRKLAAGRELIEAFLGKDIFDRLLTYVQGLSKGAARGRTAVDIATDAADFETFARDVREFAEAFEAPEFTPEKKNLIKLKAFLEAKLPQ